MSQLLDSFCGCAEISAIAATPQSPLVRAAAGVGEAEGVAGFKQPLRALLVSHGLYYLKNLILLSLPLSKHTAVHFATIGAAIVHILQPQPAGDNTDACLLLYMCQILSAMACMYASFSAPLSSACAVHHHDAGVEFKGLEFSCYLCTCNLGMLGLQLLYKFGFCSRAFVASLGAAPTGPWTGIKLFNIMHGTAWFYRTTLHGFSWTNTFSAIMKHRAQHGDSLCQQLVLKKRPRAGNAAELDTVRQVACALTVNTDAKVQHCTPLWH